MVKQGLLLMALTASAGVGAQQSSPWSVEFYGVGGAETDFEQGSDLQQQQYGGSLGYVIPLGRGRLIGVDASMDWHHFDFSNLNASNAPFYRLDMRERYELSAFYMMPLNQQWSVLVSPQVQWAYADGADASDGFGYSAVMLANYKVNTDLSFGFGAAYVNGVTEVQTVPFISIDWQINDQWRLSNPFDAGFNGRAGLELTYQHSNRLQLGIGGGYRSDDFAYGEGDVKQELPLSFVRATYQVQPEFDLSFVVGYRWQGDMTLHTSAGEIDYEVDGHALMAMMANFAF